MAEEENTTNDLQSSTSRSSIVNVISSIFRPFQRPKCPSVPSSAHLHCQRHIQDIRGRMVTATALVLSMVEHNKYKNLLKVLLANQSRRSSLLRRIRSYIFILVVFFSTYISELVNKIIFEYFRLTALFEIVYWIMEYFCDTCNLWLSHLSLKSNHLEGKARECRQQPVLTNIQKSKSCQRLCQKSCLWANQRDFFGGVIMNFWRWEESCHNSLTLPVPTLVTFILAGWQAFAQRKRRKAWMFRGPIRLGTIAWNPEYIY